MNVDSSLSPSRDVELRKWFDESYIIRGFPMTVKLLKKGEAHVSMPLTPFYMVENDGLIVQGGVYMVVADAAAVLAAMSCLDRGYCKLSNFNWDCLEPTTIEDGELIACASTLLEYHKFIKVETSVYGSTTNKLKAHGTLRFSRPKSAVTIN